MKTERISTRWHRLKVWPNEFKELLTGIKSFEFRKNNRDFQAYDYLVLEEWNQETKLYTGRCVAREITSTLSGKFGMPDGFIALSLRKV